MRPPALKAWTSPLLDAEGRCVAREPTDAPRRMWCRSGVQVDDMTERQRDLAERLDMPEAILTRTDLAELGYPRRAVDVIFKSVIREGAGVQMLPGFSRPMIRVADFLTFRERCSFRDPRCAGIDSVRSGAYCAKRRD